MNAPLPTPTELFEKAQELDEATKDAYWPSFVVIEAVAIHRALPRVRAAFLDDETTFLRSAGMRGAARDAAERHAARAWFEDLERIEQADAILVRVRTRLRAAFDGTIRPWVDR